MLAPAEEAMLAEMYLRSFNISPEISCPGCVYTELKWMKQFFPVMAISSGSGDDQFESIGNLNEKSFLSEVLRFYYAM